MVIIKFKLGEEKEVDTYPMHFKKYGFKMVIEAEEKNGMSLKKLMENTY